MKFILNNDTQKTDVWLVTSDMISLFEKNGIKYPELAELGKKPNKLTLDEVGSFFLLQDLMRVRLGKPNNNSFVVGKTEAETTILNRFIEKREDVKQYFIESLQAHPMYFYRQTDNVLLLMVADKGSAEIDFPGWTLLEGDKFSVALVDMIYKQYGYQHIHFQPVAQTGDNEFSLSNAFYALEQEL